MFPKYWNQIQTISNDENDWLTCGECQKVKKKQFAWSSLNDEGQKSL